MARDDEELENRGTMAEDGPRRERGSGCDTICGTERPLCVTPFVQEYVKRRRGGDVGGVMFMLVKSWDVVGGGEGHTSCGG